MCVLWSGKEHCLLLAVLGLLLLFQYFATYHFHSAHLTVLLQHFQRTLSKFLHNKTKIRESFTLSTSTFKWKVNNKL